MPVGNFKSMMRFSAMCGASVPNWLAEAYDGLDDDPAGRVEVGTRIASEQCLELRDHGIDDFHFYTLNRADMTHAICRNLGISTAGSETQAS